MNPIKLYITSLIVAFIGMISLPAFGQTGNRVFDNYQEGVDHIQMKLVKTIEFSDSSVRCAENKNGKQVLVYVQNQGFGEVFDPSSDLYDKKTSLSGNFTMDSIGFAYEYHYVPEIGAAPDTLIFQFYEDTAIGGKTILTGRMATDPTQTNYENFSFIRYDFQKNLGKSSIATLKYLLTAKDSLAQFIPGRFLNIALNNKAGIELKKGHLFAFTVSYRPGFAYTPGDTISETFLPRPKRLHSHFNVIQAHTLSNSDIGGFENSLSVITQIRYNITSNGWNGYYIPGNAWTDFNQFLWTRFYVHGILKNSGISTNDLSTKYSVYPNPASQYVMIKSDGISTYTYQLFNTAGMIVANGSMPFNNMSTSIDISFVLAP